MTLGKKSCLDIIGAAIRRMPLGCSTCSARKMGVDRKIVDVLTRLAVVFRW